MYLARWQKYIIIYCIIIIIIINVAYTPRIWESDSQSMVFTEIKFHWKYTCRQ